MTEKERLNKLRLAIARAVTELHRIANWRADCHDYDGDMGYPPRDFSDTEELDRLETEAKRIKLALATAEPPLEVEDSSEANVPHCSEFLGQGWRGFLCSCGYCWKQTTRDWRSPSLECCPKCNEETDPIAAWPDASVEVDEWRNLKHPSKPEPYVPNAQADL